MDAVAIDRNNAPVTIFQKPLAQKVTDTAGEVSMFAPASLQAEVLWPWREPRTVGA